MKQKFYIVMNSFNGIGKMHPSNSERITSCVDRHSGWGKHLQDIFCASKKYGLFYVSGHGQNNLCQSRKL